MQFGNEIPQTIFNPFCGEIEACFQVSYVSTLQRFRTLRGVWMNIEFVITSYSIHYTKLYDIKRKVNNAFQFLLQLLRREFQPTRDNPVVGSPQNSESFSILQLSQIIGLQMTVFQPWHFDTQAPMLIRGDANAIQTVVILIFDLPVQLPQGDMRGCFSHGIARITGGFHSLKLFFDRCRNGRASKQKIT